MERTGKLQWPLRWNESHPCGASSHGEESAHGVGVRASASVRNTREERVQWSRDVVWPECDPLHVALHPCVLAIMKCSEQQQRGQCQLLTFS